MCRSGLSRMIAPKLRRPMTINVSLALKAVNKYSFCSISTQQTSADICLQKLLGSWNRQL